MNGSKLRAPTKRVVTDFRIGGGQPTLSPPPCEFMTGETGERLVKEHFGQECQLRRERYGRYCHEICRIFKKDYDLIKIILGPERSEDFKRMDEELMLKWDDRALTMKSFYNQAEIFEVYGSYNRQQTRLNLGLGHGHKLKDDELWGNFDKWEAPKDFPFRWRVMVSEIDADENRYYAWQKFCNSQNGLEPSLNELFWTYRMGRAFEYFGRNHPDKFHPRGTKNL